MKNRIVYMDNNATTPLHPEVKRAMAGAMDLFGNASSFHQFGRRSREYIEAARGHIAGFIGAKPDEIIFVGNGSEANNTVLNTITCTSHGCEACHSPRRAIITSSIEHPCIMETSKCLESRGAKVFYLKVDGFGKADLRQLEELLSNEKAGLVSVMMANNEIGTIQDIKRIAALAHKYGALAHTDAVQALGKIPVDVDALGVDFLSLSAHKVCGPKGVGALYVREGSPYCPFIRGGHQEKGRRAGTENTLGIVGFGRAVEMLKVEMADDAKRMLRLKTALKEGIEKRVPDILVNGHPADSLPGTLNISFDGAEGEAILLYLDLAGIAVSTGSACSSGSLDPSHVILATGVSAERAHGSIRFSLGRENTEEDVDYVLEKLPQIMSKIRRMSTAYGSKRPE